MQGSPAHHAFIDLTYDQATELLVSLRDYVADQAATDAQRLSPEDRIRLNWELTRVTRQVLQMMSWLLLNKAVMAGELEASEAATRPEMAFDDGDKTHASGPATLARLPLEARSLIDRTRRLHAQALRLVEAGAAIGSGGPAAPDDDPPPDDDQPPDDDHPSAA